MSWFRVDDGWADSAKVDAISDVAARLWAICGTWCSKKENRWLDGFVPRAALQTITKRRWSDEVIEAAIVDLVETSKVGGLFEHGLWEEREGGWMFHDWDEYKPRESDEPTMTPSEAASVAGQASVKARREKSGTAQPQKPRNSSNVSRTSLERPKPFDAAFDRTNHSNVSRTPEPPDPDPVPFRSDPEVGSKDLTGTQREDAPLHPPPPPSVTRVRSETRPANAEAQPVQGVANATGGAHSEPPRSQPPSEPKCVPLASRRVRATDDLMSCPVGELAKRCRLNQYDASMAPLGERPELVRVSEAWAQAVGVRPRPLGAYGDRNKPLLALLEAFEVATEAELLAVCEVAARDDWCTGRKGSERDPARKRDLGCLTQTVLRRLLDAVEERRPKFVHPRVAAFLAEEKRREAAQ